MFFFQLLNILFRVRNILWLKIYPGFHQYLFRSCPHKGACLRHKNLPQALFAKLWPWEEEREKADTGRVVFLVGLPNRNLFSNLHKGVYVLALRVPKAHPKINNTGNNNHQYRFWWHKVLQVSLYNILFFFFKLINLFIFGCVGSLFLCEGFL